MGGAQRQQPFRYPAQVIVACPGGRDFTRSVEDEGECALEVFGLECEERAEQGLQRRGTSGQRESLDTSLQRRALVAQAKLREQPPHLGVRSKTAQRLDCRKR